MSVQQQDPDGFWRQSIPLPFYSRRWLVLPAFKCWECKHKFRTEQAYRDHYRSDHPATPTRQHTEGDT